MLIVSNVINMQIFEHFILIKSNDYQPTHSACKRAEKTTMEHNIKKKKNKLKQTRRYVTPFNQIKIKCISNIAFLKPYKIHKTMIGTS